MSHHSTIAILASLALGVTAFAGTNDQKTITPAEPEQEQPWRFSLSLPGWIPWMTGESGVNGNIAQIDLDPSDIIPRLDMIADVRAEAHKGRFSVLGEFVYMSLSDGIGTRTVVKKLDVQIDQTIGELSLAWRLVESERGWLDVYAGLRYTNFYQKLKTQPNSERIEEVSTDLVDEVGDRLRTTLNKSELREIVEQRIGTQIAALAGRKPTLPSGPLAGRERTPILDRINEIIDARKAALAAALRDQAAAATAALREEAQARVNAIKRDLGRKIARALESKLDTTISRTDDWWDPYVGLRGRYNLSTAFYLTAKGDIGGFGVGCDLTWQAEAALGVQMTRNIFTELGYRALSVDYDKDGLTIDSITHGPQMTLGIIF